MSEDIDDFSVDDLKSIIIMQNQLLSVDREEYEIDEDYREQTKTLTDNQKVVIKTLADKVNESAGLDLDYHQKWFEDEKVGFVDIDTMEHLYDLGALEIVSYLAHYTGLSACHHLMECNCDRNFSLTTQNMEEYLDALDYCCLTYYFSLDYLNKIFSSNLTGFIPDKRNLTVMFNADQEITITDLPERDDSEWAPAHQHDWMYAPLPTLIGNLVDNHDEECIDLDMLYAELDDKKTISYDDLKARPKQKIENDG